MAPSASTPSLIADLGSVLAPERVAADGLARRLYGRDASTMAGEAGVVCFPTTTAEVADVVRVAARHDAAVVARGSGTGLAGGAVPRPDAVVVVTTQMRAVGPIDVEARTAWVEPGVLNLDLSAAVASVGLRFSPDPSSQQACSIGGNVANNSGGPHCLRDGVTTEHVLAVEMVLGDGSVVTVGGADPEPPGFDLRGVVVGSEGTFGIITGALVRLVPQPPAVATLLAGFADTRSATEAVSAVIASGRVPAAMEMMDQGIVAAVEAHTGAGLPADAAAVLLVEVDGAPSGVAADVDGIADICRTSGATTVSVAADEAERAGWWKARKSAFGAVARILPDYYLHDTVVPRTRLTDVLDEVYAIADRHDLKVVNVFHAGDGNLHPLLLFDRRIPGTMERVTAAGDEIVAASLAAGGVLSGEHGIGLEKRDMMPLMFDDTALEVHGWVRDVFDPSGRVNPAKVLPAGVGCGEAQNVPEGVWV